MKVQYTKLAFGLLLTACFGTAYSQQTARDTQEIFFADPTIYVHGGKYYLTGTRGAGGGPAGFAVLESKNLKTWAPPAVAHDSVLMILTSGDHTFGTRGFWAPQLFRTNDTWYLTYTANEQTVLASSASLTGPYRQDDIGPIDSTEKNIDSFLFKDDDGTYYLYHVRFDKGNYLWVAEFDLEKGRIKPETLTKCFGQTEPWEATPAYKSAPIMEGPTVVRLKNKYYLFYSANHFENIDYSVGYAVSDSPLGPWEKQKDSPIIHRSIVGENGSGHGDLFEGSDGRLYYVYHVHFSDHQVSPRRTRIVPVTKTWDSSAEVYKFKVEAEEVIVPVRVEKDTQAQADDYLEMTWKHVATRMPSEWYGTKEARSAAEIVLKAQKDVGGWAKNKDYHRLSASEITELAGNGSEIGATFDNGSTIRELRFLARVYGKLGDQRYKEAFLRGLHYIFLSQYDNGGWPQFYPVREGSVAYSGHITYNDDSMVNIMRLLKDIWSFNEDFASLELSRDITSHAKKAFDKGIECILNTQIIVNGTPSVWCAQHDRKTLEPVKARSYELPSFSGSESVDIVLLLMSIQNPSKEIIEAVNGAIDWFWAHQIKGIKLETFTRKDGKEDLAVIHVEGAPSLWARFYDLDTGKPFFCDRDGIKRESLAEVGYERRNGYSWYTDAPRKLIGKYPAWKAKWGK